MKNRIVNIVFYFIIAFLCVGASDAVEINAQVDTSRPIYAGSPFVYGIIINNGDNADSVNTDPLKSFNPVGPSVQSRTSIINGRTSSSYILSYQMTAPAKGTITIPSVEVTIKGQVYRTNPVAITIAEPGSTKQIDIEMSLSEKQCFVGQPIVLTTIFYVWADIVRAKAIANITLQIPALLGDAFYVENMDASGLNTNLIGLSVNNQEEGFSQDQTSHAGIDCVRLRLQKVLIPKKAGQIQLGVSSISADIAVSQKQRSRDPFFNDFFGNQYEYQRFMASCADLQLDVLPLPEQNKPADFYGLVGSYTITATANPTEVNVGDPITLTIKIGGEKYLKPVQWPGLDKIPLLAENFKIPFERSDGEIKDGFKIFTQTIRANNDKVTEIPPIPLTFFDTVKGLYITKTSEPIPLKVSPTKVVTQAEVEGGSLVSNNRQLQAVIEGLSANYTSPDALVNQQFTLASAILSPLFIFLWATPFTILMFSAITKTIIIGLPQRKTAYRRKNACARTVSAIKSINRSSQKTEEQLITILKQYIADKYDRIAGSLTAEECRQLVFEQTQNSDIADSFKAIMQDIEAAAYSSADYEFNKDKQQQIIDILKKIGR